VNLAFKYFADFLITEGFKPAGVNVKAIKHVPVVSCQAAVKAAIGMVQEATEGNVIVEHPWIFISQLVRVAGIVGQHFALIVR